jgi:hypothetical protein
MTITIPVWLILGMQVVFWIIIILFAVIGAMTIWHFLTGGDWWR